MLQPVPLPLPAVVEAHVEVCVLEEPQPAVVELDVEVLDVAAPELAVEEPEVAVCAFDEPDLLDALVDVDAPLPGRAGVARR